MHEKTVCGTFEENDNLIMSLSRVCYGLLKDNTTILSDINWSFYDTGGDIGIVSSLFAVVRDCSWGKRYELKCLSLMEFFSAVHICNMNNPMEISIGYLERHCIQATSFVCWLISGFSHGGIIHEMLISLKIVPRFRAKTFLGTVLKLLRENDLDEQRRLKKSVQVIAHFLNDTFANKEFLLSALADLSCRGYASDCEDSNNYIEICHHLNSECGSSEGDLQNAFKNIRFDDFTIGKSTLLNFIQVFNISGITLHEIEIKSDSIRKLRMNLRNCEKVCIGSCRFTMERDCGLEEENRQLLASLDVKWCTLTFYGFRALCYLAASSEVFRLFHTSVEDAWWSELVEVIESQRNGGILKLQRVTLKNCRSRMGAKLEQRVREFAISS